MSYSIQKLVSDGTLSVVVLGVEYLQRNDIYIRIAGVETPQSGAPSGYTWSFVDNSTLRILPVVPVGVEVTVYRRTDFDSMYNVYSQNAQFDESTIDENNQQLLYIAQEYFEQGIPGASIEALEYVRATDDGYYYRFKLTDGSYTPEFLVPISPNTKLANRAMWTRFAAESGYVLAAGDFETGGVLLNNTQVLLDESTQGIYSWSGAYPEGGKVVTAGTAPTLPGSGYVPRTDVLLRNELMQYGESSLWLRTRIIAAESRFGGMVFGDSSLTAANKNSIAIQAALDYAESIGGAIVEIPCGLGYVYYNAAPVIPKDTTLFSKSLWFVKVGNHVNTSYGIDALVHTKKYTGDNCSRFGIKGIIFKGNARSVYGIYGDKTDHSFIEDCFFVNIDMGHRFADAWMCRWTNVTWNNQGYDAGIVAFEGLVGTSNTLTQCWSKNFAGGYDFGQLHYSVANGCGVDTFSSFAYFGGNGTTINGCGCEEGILTPGAKVVGCASRSMVFNTLTILSISAAPSVVAGDGTSLFNFSGTAVTMNGLRCPDLLSSGLIDLCLTSAGANVDVSPSLLPSNTRWLYNYSDAGTSRMTIRNQDADYIYIKSKGDAPDFRTNLPLKFSSKGFPMVSSKLFAGNSTLPTAQTFTGQDEAYENSHTVFSGAAGSSVNILSFTTTAAANRRSSIVMDIVLTGTSTGSARCWAQIDIVNGTPSVGSVGKIHGVDFTISAAFSGNTLVFTLTSTYAKALVKTTVSQSTSSGLDTFTWA